jgi:hypothetical protein
MIWDTYKNQNPPSYQPAHLVKNFASRLAFPFFFPIRNRRNFFFRASVDAVCHAFSFAEFSLY